jgi:glycogen synthase
MTSDNSSCSRDVLALVKHLRKVEGWQPQVINANDWYTELIPNYLKTFYAYTFGHIATVFTFRNLAYQGDTDGWAMLRERGMREDHSWEA